MEEKGMAHLDLINSDSCKMNGICTRAAKKYFIIFIDDATRYCQHMRCLIALRSIR
jgi:MinD superfamily P-loop ATPase